MLLVTFHGGKNAGKVNTVVGYDDAGGLLPTPVLQDAPDMSELRAVNLVSDTVLWVLSGSAGNSKILAFERTDSGSDRFRYSGQPVAQFETGSALLHPFDFVLDPAGSCYVSNQDTNVVARFDVAAGFLSASPAASPPALEGKGTFWPGTFVASSDDTLPRSNPNAQHASAIPPPAGLEDWPACKAGDCPTLVNSVRGVDWANDMLYVADEVAAVVKVYDADGNYKGQSNAIGTPPSDTSGPSEGPVHLLVANQALLATNGKKVYSASLDPEQPANLNLQPISGIKVPMVSGVALAPTGVLYAASRTQQATSRTTDNQAEIFMYTNFPADPTPGGSFPVKVDDVPEFVVYIPDGA